MTCNVQNRDSDGRAVMETINGLLKSELFTDFHVTGKESIEREIKEYIKFFNEERPAYALGYMTSKQYREAYSGNGNSKRKKWRKEIYPYCTGLETSNVQFLLTSASTAG